MTELSSAGVNEVGKVLCEPEAGVEVLSTGKTGWVTKKTRSLPQNCLGKKAVTSHDQLYRHHHMPQE